MAKILLIEDDLTLSMAIERALIHERHTIDCTIDGGIGLERLNYYEYDAAIIDWQLPSMSGVEICKEFRASGGQVPVLMLTGKKTIKEKATGFEAGADDYLTKPFDMQELLMRVRALLKRGRPLADQTLTVGDIAIDLAAGRVTKNGQEIQLTAREFALLEFFARHQNQVFSADALIGYIWTADRDASPGSIRAYITRLRMKLDDEGKDSLIRTVHKLGYRLDVGRS
jgi:DNA-binding response OmpR family regulator